MVRIRYHQPTVDYVVRRRAEGRTKRDIIRCLKRFRAREIYQRVMTDFRTRQQLSGVWISLGLRTERHDFLTITAREVCPEPRQSIALVEGA